MKFAIAFLSFLYLSFQVHAQSGLPGGRSLTNEDMMDKWLYDIKPTGKPMTNVDGSPYFLEDWVYGNLISTKKKKYEDVRLKLNLYRKQLMIQPFNQKDSFLVDDGRLLQFSLITHDTSYVFRRFKNMFGEKPEPYMDFFMVIADGEMKLLGQPTVTLREGASTAMATAGSDINDLLVRKENYYLYKAGGIIKIKPSKKSILKTFGLHQKKLNAYIQTNKLNVKNVKDLAKLVGFYNELRKTSG